MVVRQTSSEFFNQQELSQINDAVESAEKVTSGEIVPVLATQSDAYDRGLFLSALMMAALGSGIVFVVFCIPALWAKHYLPGFEAPLYALLPAQILTLLGGYHLAARIPGLHRTFLSRAQMQKSVDSAAKRAFRQFHLSATKDATGIMIYVSIFERMVVVLADHAISKQHEQATWDKVRNHITSGLADGDGAKGFSNAVEECGTILAQHFPIQPDDTNELPNHVRLM